MPKQKASGSSPRTGAFYVEKFGNREAGGIANAEAIVAAHEIGRPGAGGVEAQGTRRESEHVLVVDQCTVAQDDVAGKGNQQSPVVELIQAVDASAQADVTAVEVELERARGGVFAELRSIEFDEVFHSGPLVKSGDPTDFPVLPHAISKRHQDFGGADCGKRRQLVVAEAHVGAVEEDLEVLAGSAARLRSPWQRPCPRRPGCRPPGR